MIRGVVIDVTSRSCGEQGNEKNQQRHPGAGHCIQAYVDELTCPDELHAHNQPESGKSNRNRLYQGACRGFPREFDHECA